MLEKSSTVGWTGRFFTLTRAGKGSNFTFVLFGISLKKFTMLPGQSYPNAGHLGDMWQPETTLEKRL